MYHITVNLQRINMFRNGGYMIPCVLIVISVLLLFGYMLTPESTHTEAKEERSYLKEREYLHINNSKEVQKEGRYIKQRSQNANILVNEDGDIVIPEQDILTKLAIQELQELYHRYAESIQVRCVRQIHLGHEMDGGYHVCEDKKVVPVKPCLVYSFGISNDLSFDDAIADMFGCEVHSFDHTNGMPDHQHSPKVSFHSLGISDNNNNKKLATLGSIRKQLGHEKIHLDVLKLDAEAAEWSSVPEMLDDGSINDVKQLLVEFHLRTHNIDLNTKQDYISHLIVLRRLYQHGFRIFFFRMWNYVETLVYETAGGVIRTGCHELYFMRI